MNKTGFLVVAVLALCTGMFAQDGRFDINLNFAGKLPKANSGNGIQQRPTSSAGFLGTVGLRIAPKASLQFNWEATSNTQKYETGTLFYAVTTDVRELSGAFVFRPNAHGKWEPFFLAGGGVLSFGPKDTFIDGITASLGAVRQVQPAFLYGAGTDYRLSPNFAFRLQYRGLFYQPPDFKVPTLFAGGHGHMAEPTIGVVINF